MKTLKLKELYFRDGAKAGAEVGDFGEEKVRAEVADFGQRDGAKAGIEVGNFGQRFGRNRGRRLRSHVRQEPSSETSGRDLAGAEVGDFGQRDDAKAVAGDSGQTEDKSRGRRLRRETFYFEIYLLRPVFLAQ